jgi:curved DNA-binding protein CbpA
MDDRSDPYDVLGISRQASTSDIRKAWLALSKKYHPDKAKTEEEIRRNTIMMFKVNEAYELLFDEAKRREYDEGVSDDDEDSVDKGPSGRAYNEQNYEEAPKAKPDHLGRPYEGPDKSTSFTMLAKEPMVRMLLMDGVDTPVHIQEETVWTEEMQDLLHWVPEVLI